MDESFFVNVNQDHLRTLNQYESSFRRNALDHIDWADRLIFITGARGVGKTTLILQHITETFGPDPKALYVSMDAISVIGLSILDIARYHSDRGGTHLYIDEIHKYDRWSLELKNIYDQYRNLHVVASGSSILEIQRGQADLSRRSVEYLIEGLSFREYINIEAEMDIPQVSLTDIIDRHQQVASDLLSQVKPMMYYQDYLQHGYYPYYLESKNSYHRKLNNTLNLTIEIDLPQMLGVEITNITKIKKLIYMLTTQVPFTINVTKMSQALELNRNTLTNYLHFLEKASLFNLLWKRGKSYTLLTKPDKIYLHNTNLYHLTPTNANIGTIRECFFASQLGSQHDLRLPLQGDFIIDDQYTFEIGGQGKKETQLRGVDGGYIVHDDITIGSGNHIPLWLFGLVR